MTVDLALVEPQVVHVPVPLCEADGCGRVPTADLVWWNWHEMSLHRFEACSLHVNLLRRRFRGGFLRYPLYGSPPLEAFMPAIVQELARRRAEQAQQMWRPGTPYGTVNYQNHNITFSSGFRWVGRI